MREIVTHCEKLTVSDCVLPSLHGTSITSHPHASGNILEDGTKKSKKRGSSTVKYCVLDMAWVCAHEIKP